MDEVKLEGVIAADHPCLAGHFPGNPIVPGVVLLDWVQAAARQQWSLPALRRLPNVKFLASVKPEQAFNITLTRSHADSVSFRIESQNQLMAQGSLSWAE